MKENAERSISHNSGGVSAKFDKLELENKDIPGSCLMSMEAPHGDFVSEYPRNVFDQKK